MFQTLQQFHSRSPLRQLCKWLLEQQVRALLVRAQRALEWMEQVQQELLEQPRWKKALRPDQRGYSLHW